MCVAYPASCISASMLALGFSTASPALVFSPCPALVVVEFRLDLARPVLAFSIAQTSKIREKLRNCAFAFELLAKETLILK